MDLNCFLMRYWGYMLDPTLDVGLVKVWASSSLKVCRDIELFALHGPTFFSSCIPLLLPFRFMRKGIIILEIILCLRPLDFF